MYCSFAFYGWKNHSSLRLVIQQQDVKPEIEPRVSSSQLSALSTISLLRVSITSSWLSLLSRRVSGILMSHSFLLCVMKGLNQQTDVSTSVVHSTSAPESQRGKVDVFRRHTATRLIESKCRRRGGKVQDSFLTGS